MNMKKNNKICILSVVLTFVFVLCFAPKADAYSDDDRVSEQTDNALEKADEILSGDLFDKLRRSFTDELTASLKGSSSVFAAMIFITFLLGMMTLMSKNGPAVYAGEICLCGFAFSVIAGICDKLVHILESLRTFMLSALPAMTSLYTLSGAPDTAAVNYGTTMLLLNVCSMILTSVIVPGVKCITVFAVISFISRSFDFSGFCGFIKNTVGWLFGLLMCLLSSVIAFQNTVSAAKDGILGRTVRFAASRFIPVIGNTVSESARTLSESLRLVRSVTGIGGIITVIGIIAAPIASILICRFFVNICSACARLFSCNRASVFFGELSGVMNLVLGVTVGMSLVMIMILGMFAKVSLSI